MQVKISLDPNIENIKYIADILEMVHLQWIIDNQLVEKCKHSTIEDKLEACNHDRKKLRRYIHKYHPNPDLALLYKDIQTLAFQPRILGS